MLYVIVLVIFPTNHVIRFSNYFFEPQLHVLFQALSGSLGPILPSNQVRTTGLDNTLVILGSKVNPCSTSARLHLSLTQTAISRAVPFLIQARNPQSDIS